MKLILLLHFHHFKSFGFKVINFIVLYLYRVSLSISLRSKFPLDAMPGHEFSIYFLDRCYRFLNKNFAVALSAIQSDYGALFLPRSDFWFSSYFIITLCFCHISLRTPACSSLQTPGRGISFSHFLDRSNRFRLALSLQPDCTA